MLCIAAVMRRECPLWVKSRHSGASTSCPLCPQKRTWIGAVVTAALCQKRTLGRHGAQVGVSRPGKIQSGATERVRCESGDQFAEADPGLSFDLFATRDGVLCLRCTRNYRCDARHVDQGVTNTIASGACRDQCLVGTALDRKDGVRRACR